MEAVAEAGSGFGRGYANGAVDAGAADAAAAAAAAAADAGVVDGEEGEPGLGQELELLGPAYMAGSEGCP